MGEHISSDFFGLYTGTSKENYQFTDRGFVTGITEEEYIAQLAVYW